MRYKAMDLFHGIQSKHQRKLENLRINAFGFHSDMHLGIIKLPNSWALMKLMTRVLFLSLVLISLPWLNVITGVKGTSTDAEVGSNHSHTELLPLLFQDLANEGLLKMGDRVLFITNGNDEAMINSQVVNNYNLDVISCFDFEQRSLIPAETYDLVLAVQPGEDPRKAFQKPSNYNIEYLRRFDSTIVGMRKMGATDTKAATGRRLLGLLPSEEKKAALNNLEDVLLEPPRAASGKSKRYFKRTRYLPDLIGDSLESYPRRVFIDVGISGKNNAPNNPNWFSKHYPTRNKKFEIYNIETIMEEPVSGKTVAPVGMSDWLTKNVRENEYVVMKAEAEVVEEMVKSGSIKLVDELFLECRHRGIKKSSKRSSRAYWECLALYGMLRDEGIAVHQWWG